MKIFKYRFEKILKSKEKTENEIKKILDTLKKEIDSEKKKLLIALEKESLMRQSMAKISRNGLRTHESISDIKTHHMYLMYMSEYISRKKEKINELESKMDEVRNMLMEARMEKMTYQKLRDRDAKKHDMLEKQEEQKITDDYAIFRFRTNLTGLN
jgi:flagellar FliJ protein